VNAYRSLKKVEGKEGKVGGGKRRSPLKKAHIKATFPLFPANRAEKKEEGKKGTRKESEPDLCFPTSGFGVTGNQGKKGKKRYREEGGEKGKNHIVFLSGPISAKLDPERGRKKRGNRGAAAQKLLHFLQPS